MTRKRQLAISSPQGKVAKSDHPVPREIARHLISTDAKLRYKRFCNLKVPPGRPVVFRDFEDFGLLSYFQGSNIHKIMDHSFYQGFYPFLVKLFYSNMEVIAREPVVLRTSVLGTTINLDAASLGSILGISCTGYTLDELKFSNETIARALVIPREFRPDVDLVGGNLLVVPRLVSRILRHNIHYKMGSFTFISKESATLTYSMLQGIPINWASVILEEMKCDHSIVLPFGSLITHILEHHRVKIRSFECDTNMEFFDHTSRLRMKIDKIEPLEIETQPKREEEDEADGNRPDVETSSPSPVHIGEGATSCSWRWYGKQLQTEEEVTKQDMVDAFTMIFNGMSDIGTRQNQIQKELKRFREESSKNTKFLADIFGDRKRKKRSNQADVTENHFTGSFCRPASLVIKSSPLEKCNNSDSHDKGKQSTNQSKGTFSHCMDRCCSHCFRWKDEVSKITEKADHFRKCKVCMEMDVSMLLMPCRHFCLCQLCEPKLLVCPICNTAKASSVEVFMS